MSTQEPVAVSNFDTRTCNNIKLRVFNPWNPSLTDANWTVDFEDIASVEITQRIDGMKDEGTIVVRNDNGNNGIAIRPGNRIDVIVSDGALAPWGDDFWGAGAWGDERLLWTGLVREREFTYVGPNRSDLVLACEDYVSSVLSMRLVFDSWQNERVDDILADVIDDVASNEILQGRIGDIPETTTIEADGENALDFLDALARRSNTVFTGRQMYLEASSLDNVDPIFTLSGEDTGPLSNREIDTGLTNQIRVDGSTDVGVGDEQTVQDGYTTVTNASRETVRLDTRKSEVSQIEIWTRTTGSNESLRVRLQADDGTGTGPVAVEDETSDIASKSLSHEFLDDGGYTTFVMPDHDLPSPDPWLIIETDGATGQEIGIETASGKPTYRAYYSYQVTVQKTDLNSRRRYRKREERIKAEGASSIEAANAIAEDVLDHDAYPEHEASAPVYSRRATTLEIGQSVTLDFPRENATGDWIVTERATTIEDGIIQTDMNFTEIDTI